MQSDIIYGILLDGSGIIIMLLMVSLMFPVMTSKREEGKGLYYIFNASVAHMIGLLMRVSGCISLYMQIYEEMPLTNVVMVTALELIAVWYQIKYMCMDADGVCRLFHRKNLISVGCVAAIFVPFIVTIGLESLFPEFGLLGLAQSVSVSIFYIIYRHREEHRLDVVAGSVAMAQSKLLAEQMRPHFIFNALMCIEDLCYTDPVEAAHRLEDFSGYLRGNIEALSNVDRIPFEKELEHIHQYIMLEKAGAGHSFEVEQKLQVTDFLIPPLSIQPIVENAIRHGALGRLDDQGKVLFTSEQIGNFVRIIIEDNGNRKADLTTHQKKHTGVALENVKKRIALFDGSMKEEVSEAGTKITITIPLSMS